MKNNKYGYKLYKQKQNEKYKLFNYCYSYDFVLKIIEMYKRRKIIVIGENKEIAKNSNFKIIPITKYEAMMAEKDVPFWHNVVQMGFFYLYRLWGKINEIYNSWRTKRKGKATYRGI